MNNRLSHSAVEVFKECSFKYALHYKEKLRSETTGSALLFGSAIDKALEFVLKEMPNENINALKDLALETFVYHWTHAELNGQTINLTKTNLVKYSKADYELDEDPYISLLKKGTLIIEAFFRDVLPQIESVVSTQEEIALINDNGDSVIGYCDAVLKLKGYDQNIIVDFKTSARKYKDDSVKTSPQLSLYKHSLSEKYNTTTAGYIVFIKTINKNPLKICTKCDHDNSDTSHKTCNNQILHPGDKKLARCCGELTITYRPKIDVQIVIDKIDEEFENKLLESFDDINVKLQQEVFEQNFDKCYGKYGKCLYFDYCRTSDTTGLIVVPSKEKVNAS